MPFLKIQTSVSQPDSASIDALLTLLSTKLAKHLSKPESYVMTAFEPNLRMTFAGTFDTINGTSLGDGLSWDTSKLYTQGSITVVPEPSTALIGGLGILALLRRRR